MNRKNNGNGYSIDDVRYDPVAAYQLACELERKHKSPRLVQSLLTRSADQKYDRALIKLAGRLIRGYYYPDDDLCAAAPVKNEVVGVQRVQEAVACGCCVANYLIARAYLDGIGVEADKMSADAYLNCITEDTYDAAQFEAQEIMAFGNVSHELHNMLYSKLNKDKHSGKR